MTDLEAVIYGALMHHGKPRTIEDFERAARTVAEMLERRQSAAPAQQAEHITASPELDAEVDRKLGLVLLPPIRVNKSTHDALLEECQHTGLILQAVVRGALADAMAQQAAPSLMAGSSPAEGDGMLKPLIYAAMMHNGKPKTVAEFERAAATVADMLERRAIAQPLPEALPHPGSPEASAMIDSVLAEYQWPSNTKNAARSGYVAAKRLMRDAQAEPVASYPHPDEDDAVTLWAEIHRLRAAVKGPDGFDSWQDAATAERVRRVKAEAALKERQDKPAAFLRHTWNRSGRSELVFERPDELSLSEEATGVEYEALYTAAAPQPAAQAEPVEYVQDARIDRAYVAGAQAGFALGNAGNNEGLRKLCESRAEAVAVLRAASNPPAQGQEA